MAGESDDLLNPDEIEALLQSAGAPKPASSPPKPAAPPAPEGDLLDAGEIEALLQQAGGPAKPPPKPAPKPKASPSAAESLLNQVESDLAAAIASDLDGRHPPSELGKAQPFQFQMFDGPGDANAGDVPLDALADVELDLRIELGRAELLIDEVVQLKEGSVVPLDKLAGDPVDILVNGRLIARGEVLVLNDNFCVRVAEILAPDF